MQKYSKILVGVIIVVAVVGAGLFIGWWGGQGKAGSQPAPVAENAPAMEPAAQDSLPAVDTQAHRPLPVPQASNATPATSANAAAGATNLTTNWEDKLDNILGSDEADTNKVAQLFQMFPSLPEDGQAEVAEHLSNLVPDDQYAPLGKLLENPKLPASVLDVLMSDVLDRPDSVKLPLLLKVAQTPGHPEADEAKDLLELYLDEDNPALWPQKMQAWLKANPD